MPNPSLKLIRTLFYFSGHSNLTEGALDGKSEWQVVDCYRVDSNNCGQDVGIAGVLIKGVAGSLCINLSMSLKWHKQVRERFLVGTISKSDSDSLAKLKRMREVKQVTEDGYFVARRKAPPGHLASKRRISRVIFLALSAHAIERHEFRGRQPHDVVEGHELPCLGLRTKRALPDSSTPCRAKTYLARSMPTNQILIGVSLQRAG